MRGIAMAIILAGSFIQYGMLRHQFTQKERELSAGCDFVFLIITILVIAGGW